MSSRAESARPRPPGPKNFTEWYLLSYNQVSLLGWVWILFMTWTELSDHDWDYRGVFNMVWPSLNMVQTFAVMEVVHSMFGLVRAPVITTAMQVASRLFLVWGVNYLVPEIHSHWSFTTMMLAWSVAEIVRYSYYALHLSSGVPGFISWVRYHFFFVLYPLGVFSELMMIYQALPFAHNVHPLYYYLLVAVALVYIPGFPVLFSHMLAQRKKYMRGDLKKKE
ncbi:tyrosine phosphatase-like protein [Mucor mucedo]|uniref:tyrosine phosphatase-like protein n=1 Tax=Mucor mucedo TaxID=29922 RepID=UPI00221EF0EF|nr:tyrosine phosphatase-like protein [Mucor mucedo]KAI7891819.1 tyrosine phosphatase-like protein [Mucor mucedo]